MTPTARLRAYIAIAAMGIVFGLALGLPDLVAVGSPFLVVAGVGMTLGGIAPTRLEATFDREQAIEGEQLTLELSLEVPRRAVVSIALPPMAGISVEEVKSPDLAGSDGSAIWARVPAGASQLDIKLRCILWGAYLFDSIPVDFNDSLGLISRTVRVPINTGIKVYPSTPKLRQLLAPIETQLGFGDLLSRQRGEGTEYADLRPFGPGDDPRRINWRVTARSNNTWVTERHPERNSDVVVMIDAFAEARRGIEQTLDMAIRAAAALTSAHLRRHDRVGVIVFGERVRWLQPGMGNRQRYQALDMLVRSRFSGPSFWRGIDVVPPSVLPSGALVVGLTPLLDERPVNAFANMRGRGYDLAIALLSPEPYLESTTNTSEALARRIWRLERDRLRRRFESNGVAVSDWDPREPFPQALVEVETYRRNALRRGA